MKNLIKNPFFDNFQLFLLSLLPAALVSGLLISEIIINLISLFFLIDIFINKKLNIFKNKLFIYFLFFYIFLIFSLLSSEIIKFSALNVFSYFRFFIFSFASCEILLKNKNKLIFLYLILSLTLLIVLLDGYIQFFTGENLLGYPKYRIDRISGFFNDDLILGSYLFRILPVYLGLTFYLKDKIKKFFYLNLVICLSTVALIFLTGERASFFLTLIFLIIIFLQINLNKKIIVSLFTIILLFLIGMFTINPTIYDRYVKQTISQVFGTDTEEVFLKNYSPMYNTAFKMFLSKPLVGFGPKSYRHYCSDDDFVSYYKTRIKPIDNTIITPQFGMKNSLKNFIVKKTFFNEGDFLDIGDKLFLYYFSDEKDLEENYKPYFSKKEGIIKNIIIKEKYTNNDIYIKLEPQRSPDKINFIPNSCNTHPHNTYLQLLSDTGIIGFIFVFTIFLLISFTLIRNFFKIIFYKKRDICDFEICLLANFFIILWPLTTSGDFFNNWLNIINYYPLVFYLFIKKNERFTNE